jgi:hypothetical protein
MNESFFIRCSADGCKEKESRAVVEGAIAAWPLHASAERVPAVAGTWRAYRGRDGRIERAYCPAHHENAVWVEGAEAA